MNEDFLNLAQRVNWYTSPDIILADKTRFLCELMARGTAEDIHTARNIFSRADFKSAYEAAPPGLFDERSWAYWGYILFSDPDSLPYPVRFIETESFNWRN